MTATACDVLVVGGGLIGSAAALGLANLGRRVVVVERAAPTLAAGEFGLDIRNVTLAPAWDTPFPDKSFDVVTMWDVIEHINAGDDERACREIARLCRRVAFIAPTTSGA